MVHIRMRGRRMRGFVAELLDTSDVPDPRPLSGVVGDEPLFSAETIELARWTARRYVVTVGSVLHAAVPGRYSAPADATLRRAAPAPASKPAWLTGEVGDGESVVVVPDARAEPELVAYLASRACGSEEAAQVLVLCPRVSVISTIARALPEAMLLHGDQRPSQRARTWAAARDGRARVVIGGRAASFLPMPGLRMVVVASAHEDSLRAERAPRFHALHVARQRARSAGAAFVVASPAPGVEIGGAAGFELVAARRGRTRPEVARPYPDPITPRLLDVVRTTVGPADQAAPRASVLVFVGRRGEALRVRCADCGWYPRCAACSVGLGTSGTSVQTSLVCRLCGERTRPPEVCGVCGGRLDARGWGDERVARALERADPGAPVVRITAAHPAPEAIPEPAVVVGTLAAAHALRREVGAVCVADLDQLLGRSDLRAAERALQTLFELAGHLRDGGRFLVQTREPDHHVVQAFTRRSYAYFLDRELVARREAAYPPFGAVVKADVLAADREALDAALPKGARAIGGVRHADRMTVLVRAPEVDMLLDPLRAFAVSHPATRFDVDPIDV